MTDDIFGGNGEFISWKDAPAGTSHAITITAAPEIVEGTDFNDAPQLQIWITGTDEAGEPVTLTMPKRSALAYAVGQAQTTSGAKIGAGGTLTVTTGGLAPSPKDAKKTFRSFTASYAPADAFAGATSEPPF